MNTTYQPSRLEISQRAREIWNSEGQPVGRDDEIWLSAEQQLKTQSRISGSRAQPLQPPIRTNDEASSVEEDADPIANNKIEERLSGFGAPPSRGATSL